MYLDKVTVREKGRTQAERRQTTRIAVLEAAARGLSCEGYSALKLDSVAADAGYTRGAIYHLFASKEELALEVIAWIRATFADAFARASREHETDPVAALTSLARGYALYWRLHPHFARAVAALNVEFASQNHPVQAALAEAKADLVDWIGKLVTRGRRQGSIPPGPPVQLLSRGIAGAMEGVLFWIEADAPHASDMAERVMLGLLGVRGPCE
jgi:AcrR family transcriptional regulator